MDASHVYAHARMHHVRIVERRNPHNPSQGKGCVAGEAARVRAWRDGHEPDDARRITDRRPPPRKGRDVYVYFDNDQGGHAPRDGARLRERARA